MAQLVSAQICLSDQRSSFKRKKINVFPDVSMSNMMWLQAVTSDSGVFSVFRQLEDLTLGLGVTDKCFCDIL